MCMLGSFRGSFHRHISTLSQFCCQFSSGCWGLYKHSSTEDGFELLNSHTAIVLAVFFEQFHLFICVTLPFRIFCFFCLFLFLIFCLGSLFLIRWCVLRFLSRFCWNFGGLCLHDDTWLNILNDASDCLPILNIQLTKSSDILRIQVSMPFG